ncbi:MAG: hypothetical protein PW788_14495 [Micavibrio sp.]|nr:hypothetical protein [Micavibrio sp.]
MQIINIEGMTCQSCVQKISSALRDAGMEGKVSLSPPTITFENTVPDRKVLADTLSKAGNYRIKDEVPSAPQEKSKSWIETYYPIILIVGFISVVSLKGVDSWYDWMLHFMAGFFIVFSFFKLLDLRGFKDAYMTYDLLAKEWQAYGYVYPFLELLLGLAFLFQIGLKAALSFSVLLMAFSSLGVIKALSEKRKIKCACLGTVLNLPMSTITLVEDLGMVVMSVLMLAS